MSTCIWFGFTLMMVSLSLLGHVVLTSRYGYKPAIAATIVFFVNTIVLSLLLIADMLIKAH